MKLYHTCPRRGRVVGVLLLTLIVACGTNKSLTPIATSTQDIQTILPTEPLATSTAPPPLPETPTPFDVEPTALPTEPSTPTAHSVSTVAFVVIGDYEQADLHALGDDGSTWPVYQNVGQEVSLSPDGRWLGFVRWSQDGRATLELHNVQTGESHQVTPDAAGGVLNFAFDPSSRRLAYLDLGAYSEEGVPWTLVIMDLESGAVARYDALMVGSETRPLPGSPVGWSSTASAGEELIIDTFMPGTEAGRMGVWGVTLPADGASAPLDTLPLRELIPSAPAYFSRLYLAPDRQSAAFLGRDLDYVPDNYYPEFYDLAVNRLEIAALDDGTRTTLLEASDGSALGRALVWSPAGDRLLFTQGNYEGENFGSLSLKSSDRSGTIVEYGPLTLPPLGDLFDLAWCDKSLALYVTWDGGDGTHRLLSFDLNTGISTEISAGQRVEIVGCAP